MKNYDVSFKSNIKFVKATDYAKIMREQRISAAEIDHLGNFLVHSGKFYTEEIRTCTGGGFVTPRKHACGFHIYHSEFFNKAIDVIINGIFDVFKPERALLIGGKNFNNPEILSMENFKKIKQIALKKVKNLTLFEQHKHLDSESNFYYSLKNDTWLINCFYLNHNEEKLEVDSIARLLSTYKKINIANGDRLFIGEKEILPKDCPEIFAKNWRPPGEGSVFQRMKKFVKEMFSMGKK
jgi:hypothetical protein